MNLPERRRGYAGAPDVGQIGLRKLSWRHPIRQLARNRAGRRRWPLVDSTGARILTVGDGDYELQGLGAMLDPQASREHVLLAVNDSDFTKRVRGFVPLRAIPRELHHRLLDHVTGRGEHLPGVRETERFAITDPGFHWYEKFEGSDGKLRSYVTYNAHPRGGVYVCANTTGVRGGGIVRAVVPVGWPAVLLDLLPPDANGGGVCRWRYIRVGHSDVRGWIATRA